MAFGRLPASPLPPPLAEGEGTSRRLSSTAWKRSQNARQPSEAVIEVIEHNREHIDVVARYSAMRAMPMLLAEGERNTLDECTKALTAAIEELVRRALDDEDGHVQDNCSIFSVEVAIEKRSGDGFSDHAKNLYVLDVDVTIPLEFAHLPFPPRHYGVGKRLAKHWYEDEA